MFAPSSLLKAIFLSLGHFGLWGIAIIKIFQSVQVCPSTLSNNTICHQSIGGKWSPNYAPWGGLEACQRGVTVTHVLE